MSNVSRDRLLLAIAIILAGLYLFPLYWMYITTIKSGSEMFATPPTFWPSDPQWQILGNVWQSRNMGLDASNSLVIACGSVSALTVLGVGCAYVLARYRSARLGIGLFLILML